MIAVGIVFINPVDSEIFATKAPAITEAIIHLAQVKPAFRKFLQRTSESMVYAELIAAVVPIVILILVNHKMLPAFMAIPYGGMPAINTPDMQTTKASHNNANNGQSNIYDFLSSAMAAGGAFDHSGTDRER